MSKFNEMIEEIDFRQELTSLINKHSKENGSDTPDFILADYLIQCLKTFDSFTNERGEWYKPDVRSSSDGN